jgi:site-specific recombinase XerD
MARRKSKKPSGLFKNDIDEKNRMWLNEFEKATNRVASYYDNIENFLSFKDFTNKPFNQFTETDVWPCIQVMLDSGFSPHTRNTLISELSQFRDYLKNKHPDDFPEHFLKDLEDTFRDTHVPSEYSIDSEALSLSQLSLIRRYNRRESSLSLQDEYLFELFFQLGIKKEQVLSCHPHKANKQNFTFTYKGKEIKFNDQIAELIEKISSVEQIIWNTNTANRYFERITFFLKQKGEWHKDRTVGKNDLKKTHDAYIFTCPVCGRRLENHAGNWVLAKTDIDDEYHVVCAVCKGGCNEN